MSVNNMVKTGLASVDRVLSERYVKKGRDKPAVYSLLFHTVFDDAAELGRGVMYPQQGFCLDDYRLMFERLRDTGFEFVNSQQILAGLDPERMYANITFDDGYFNNFKILPLLEEFEVPIDLFVVTGHVERQECFSYDVVYRERLRQGLDPQAIIAEHKHLKTLTHTEAEEYLLKHFGAGCQEPWGDLDRPMTVDEVTTISRNRWVRVGNHTESHCPLTYYSGEDLRAQIADSQQKLQDWLGYRPNTFAYPVGKYERSLYRILADEGIELALTCDFRKIDPARLHEGDSRFSLGRFCFSGPDAIDEEITRFRHDRSLSVLALNTFHRLEAVRERRRVAQS